MKSWKNIRNSLILFWAVVMIPGPAVSHAAHVVCGDILTTDTVLDDSLLDCPGDGVVIAADNLTLHLNGKILKGTNSPGSVGIRLVERTGVTVKGPGVVERFEGGIDVTGGSKNTVKDVIVANNKLASCTPVVPPGPRGIQFLNSAKNAIKRNAVINNCRGIVLVVPDSQGKTVKENSVNLNVFFGILLRNGPRNNTVEKNTVTSNMGPGILLAQGVTENEVAENFVHTNVVGIALQGNADKNQIKENVITNNGAVGIRLGFDAAPVPVLSDNDANEIKRNVIGNQAFGIQVQDASDDGDVIRGNTIFSTGTPISDSGTGTVIQDNETN